MEQLSGMNIGFIGGGNMAEALIRQGIAAGLDASRMWVSDIAPLRLAMFDELGMHTTGDNAEVLQQCALVMLAVKPQMLKDVLPTLQAQAQLPVIVSILAGCTVEQLQRSLPEGTHYLRVMPNMAARVGEGMTAFSQTHTLSDQELAWAQAFFGCAGRVELVREDLMDVVTALIGSAPAFVCMFAEALADSAVQQGLPRQQAYAMATQMVLGTGKILADSQIHPAVLKDQICSPAGTTIEGVCALENDGFRAALIHALKATTERCRALRA